MAFFFWKMFFLCILDESALMLGEFLVEFVDDPEKEVSVEGFEES